MADDDGVDCKKSEENSDPISPEGVNASGEDKKITVTVKTPKEKETFTVDENLGVKAVRQVDTFLT